MQEQLDHIDDEINPNSKMTQLFSDLTLYYYMGHNRFQQTSHQHECFAFSKAHFIYQRNNNSIQYYNAKTNSSLYYCTLHMDASRVGIQLFILKGTKISGFLDTFGPAILQLIGSVYIIIKKSHAIQVNKQILLAMHIIHIILNLLLLQRFQ